MKLPLFKKLSVESFEDQSDWIGKLFYPLNQFIGTMRLALNNNLTFSENMNAQVKELTITESTSYPLYFSATVNSKPDGLWVIGINEISGAPANFTSAVFIDWEYVGNSNIKIKAITGIDNTKTYNLKMIVIGK